MTNCRFGSSGRGHRQAPVHVVEGNRMVANAGLAVLGKCLPSITDVDTPQIEPDQQRRQVLDVDILCSVH